MRLKARGPAQLTLSRRFVTCVSDRKQGAGGLGVWVIGQRPVPSNSGCYPARRRDALGFCAGLYVGSTSPMLSR